MTSTLSNETRRHRPARRLRYLSTSGWLLFAHRLAATLLFTLIRFLFVGVQQFFWELNGTMRHLRRVASDLQAYDNSVHVVDILYYNAFDEIASTYPEDFIYVHNRFESPQFIIDNDNITLMGVDEKHAVFIEADKADQHLWRSEYAPFSKVAHALYGRRLLFVPIHVFHRMSKAVGSVDEGLVFIYNTARCGSTLITHHTRDVLYRHQTRPRDLRLFCGHNASTRNKATDAVQACLSLLTVSQICNDTKVFESTGRCVAISEPAAIDDVGRYLKKHGDTAEVRKMAHDVIRWICRPYKTFKPSCYVLKPMAGFPDTAKLFKEIFPQAHLIFMYREYTAVVKSMDRASYQIPSLYMCLLMEKMTGKMTKRFLKQLKVEEFQEIWLVDERLRFGALFTAVMMKTFVDLHRQGLPVFTLRYEDLVNEPLHVCQQLMKVCGLPNELAEKAVLALNKDSQRDSPLAKTVLRRFPELKVTEQSRKSLNRILAKAGLPLIGSDVKTEGFSILTADTK